MSPKKPQPTAQPDLSSQPTKVGIPNARGAVRLTGHEELVKSFATNNAFFKKLKGDVDKDKETFRQHAANAVTQLKGDVKRVEFVDESGNTVEVTVPDYEKAGNRSALDESTLAFTEQILDMDGLLEETQEVRITDQALAKWFIDYAAQVWPNGAPAGVDIKTVTRLTSNGITKLYELAADPDPAVAEAAKLLLQSGRKAFSVG